MLSRERRDDVIEGHAVDLHDAGERDADSRTLRSRVARLARLALPAGVARLALPAASDQQPAAGVQQLAAGRADLQARLDKLLQRSPTHDLNRKLLGHLANESEHLLTFLEKPGVQATNWRAEQAIRPAVVNRKHWGANRTWHGADTQQVLMSVIRTARQQNTDPVALLRDLQRQSVPTVTAALKLPTATPQPPSPADSPQPARGP